MEHVSTGTFLNKMKQKEKVAKNLPFSSSILLASNGFVFSQTAYGTINILICLKSSDRWPQAADLSGLVNTHMYTREHQTPTQMQKKDQTAEKVQITRKEQPSKTTIVGI